MPRNIDWSKTESNVRLLAATYAVIGKDAFSGCFADIARLFGQDATYDSVNHRFRAIAERAEQLQEGLSYVPRPAITRKRRRRDHTPTPVPEDLEPDDYLVIQEAQKQTPKEPSHKSSALRRKFSKLESQPNPSSIANVEEHVPNSELWKNGDNVRLDAGPSPPDALAPSSDEPVSCSFEADMAAKADETLEARMARSSQGHAEQRARSRRMYMDTPSTKNKNRTPAPSQKPQSPDPLFGAMGGIDIAKAASYIDLIKKKCTLCNLKWTDLKKAQEHEALSEFHRSNLLQPELVQAAHSKSFEVKQYCQSMKRMGEYVPGRTTGVDESQAGPSMDTSAPVLPPSQTPFPAPRTRESSVIIVEAPARRNKGKERTMPAPMPTPVRHHRLSKEIRSCLARGRTNLPKYQEAFEVMEDLLRGVEREQDCVSSPSSSVYVESACDDSQNEDYMSR